MKKLIACLLILLLLTACAKPAAAPEEPSLPAVTEPVEKPEPETKPEKPAEDLFVFTRENLPKLDGSTSMVPLGQALAAALLGESQSDVENLIDFHRTTESFRYLMRGESDLLLVAEPNQVVFDEMEQAGFAYEMEPIAKEALVFIVNSDNPIDSLTVEQLQDIYSGQITNWSQVGGSDVDIVPFQRNKTSGSQVLMDKLVMGDLEMMEAPQEWIPGEMDTLMQGVRGYEDSAAAIGYSVYYYAEDMRMAEGMKILSVEGVEPTDETIFADEYPLINPYFAVIDAETEADSPTRILFDWIRSSDGQMVLESQGYVPVGTAGELENPVYMDVSGLTGFEQPMEIFTRHTEGFSGSLLPGNYGLLRPYIGSRAAFDMTIYGGSGIYNGYKGLIDDTGAIVVDPVYTDIAYLYDQSIGKPVPFYRLSKEIRIENDWGGYMGQIYGFCSLDGKIVVPCQYEQIVCWGNQIVAVQDAKAGLFHVYDTAGNLLLDSAGWQQRPAIYLSDGMGTTVATEHLLFFSVQAENGEPWDVEFHLYDWQGNLISDKYDWVELSGEPPYAFGHWDQSGNGYLDAWGRELEQTEHPAEQSEPDLQAQYPHAEQVQDLGNGLILVWQDGICTLVKDGKSMILEGAEDPYRDYYSYGDETDDLILIQCYLQQKREFWLLDDDLKLLAHEMLENEGVELLTDRLSGKSVAVRYSTVGNYYPYVFRVLDYPGAPKLADVNVLGIYNGWYMVEDEFTAGYMDENGSWLFRISLMADMTD